MEHRFITKNFLCENCYHRFKKLVSHDENLVKCNSCLQVTAHLLEDSEFNRENMDRTYSLSFPNGGSNISSEFHPVTDILDRDPQNIYGDSRRRYHPRRNRTQEQPPSQRNSGAESTPRRQQQQGSRRYPSAQTTSLNNDQSRQVLRYPSNLNLFYFPFTVSPFHGSVNRHTNNFSNFNHFFSDIFNMPSNDFFMDNFASNFTSNFTNPLSRIVFSQSMQNEQPQGTPPASKEVIKKLKRFKMNKEFCKKGEKKDLEYPTCSVCLSELAEGEDSVFVQCGHLFHELCIVKWLELHNSCPVCRYELPTESINDRERHPSNNTSTNQMYQ